MTHYSNVIRLLESAKPVKFNLLDRTLEGSIVLMLIYNGFLSLAVHLGYVQFEVKMAYEYWFLFCLISLVFNLRLRKINGSN